MKLFSENLDGFKLQASTKGLIDQHHLPASLLLCFRVLDVDPDEKISVCH